MKYMTNIRREGGRGIVLYPYRIIHVILTLVINDDPGYCIQSQFYVFCYYPPRDCFNDSLGVSSTFLYFLKDLMFVLSDIHFFRCFLLLHLPVCLDGILCLSTFFSALTAPRIPLNKKWAGEHLFNLRKSVPSMGASVAQGRQPCTPAGKKLLSPGMLQTTL